MKIQTKETYSEVYAVLEMLGDNYIRMLPESLYDMIKEQKSNEYIPQYTEELPLERQCIRKETISIIALLHLNYWCKTDEEKEKLKAVFKENDNKCSMEMREKIANLHKEEKTEDKSITEKQNIMPDIYKESVLTKIINTIKKILRLS